MPAPFTVVTLADEDGDMFPIRLPGVYRENRAADMEAALQIIREEPEMEPSGAVRVESIAYYCETA